MPSLAPVRIDIEVDGVRFLDTFVIDISQVTHMIIPGGYPFEDYFAELLCKEFNLLSSSFRSQIATSIKLQLEDYARYKCNIPGPPLIFLIKLDITAAGYHLVDQFDWLLNPGDGDSSDSPERYSVKFVKELSLNTEFISAISHCIREQCHWARKALANSGYDGSLNSQIPYELLGLLSVSQKAFEIRPEQEWDLYSPKITKSDDNTSISIFHPSAQERESRRLRRQMRSKGLSGAGSSLGIFGFDSGWPSNFKVIRSAYPPTLEPHQQTQN